MLHSYSSPNKLRNLFFLGLGLCGAPAAFAQTTPTPIAIGSATAVYTQNFDGMGATGTAYPDGWTGLRYGRGATATTTVNETLAPVVVLAGSTSGAVYNAGADAGSDRALGTLGSGSTVPAFGAVFINNTGSAITRVNLATQIEQWRSGSSSSVNETVVFEYSLDATNLNSGTTSTWTAVPALDLVELAISSTTAGPLNGNDAANSRAVSSSITNLNWPNGTTMWVRWRDADDAASDALLAVDNFAISTGTTPLSTRAATKNSAVSVFPNPAADVVSIRINGRNLQTPVVVTDIAGRTVLRGNVAADGTFSLRSLPSGSYILLIEDGSTTSAYKVVKQ